MAMTGSSFAAPLVTGAAALLWSWRPDATLAQVRAAILDGASRLPEWTGRTATGARLNVLGALRALAAARGEALPEAPVMAAGGSGPVSASADSSSPVAAPVPLAFVAPRARVARGAVRVRLVCASRTRACSGTVRVLGRSRAFALAPRAARAFRFPLRRARSQRLRVLVEAGERRRTFTVRVGR
jgi:hypothetical protein